MGSIRENTIRKNALNVINSDGTMGMTRKEFKDKYGVTPKAWLNQHTPGKKK